MDIQIKSFKHEYGYIEWKNIQKYVGTLEDGFDYFYKNERFEMESLKKLEFIRQGRILVGHFKTFILIKIIKPIFQRSYVFLYVFPLYVSVLMFKRFDLNIHYYRLNFLFVPMFGSWVPFPRGVHFLL